MCGIVGLFLKNEALRPDLGKLTERMLHEMVDRGPDSAGFAIYDTPDVMTKVSCLSLTETTDWEALSKDLEQTIDAQVQVHRVEDHAILHTTGDGARARNRIIEIAPDVTVLSVGQAMELFKGIGDPVAITERFGLAERSGRHAIAHTRMATESAIVIAGSHPFSTGADTCLVHNGSLSNHNRLREHLQRQGKTFQTENDSEVAAGYLAWRMRQGDSLEKAIERALEDLDGFYTLAIGTRDGFAVVRDAIACKPAVIAETEDWVAMSSEFRAIAQLPGVANADIWEPKPATVYAWSHAA